MHMRAMKRCVARPRAHLPIRREDLIQPNFSALSGVEYPEMHDESVPNMNFFARLTRLMVVCGVKDFHLNVSPGCA
jgi:hypothetical protein